MIKVHANFHTILKWILMLHSVYRGTETDVALGPTLDFVLVKLLTTESKFFKTINTK